VERAKGRACRITHSISLSVPASCFRAVAPGELLSPESDVIAAVTQLRGQLSGDLAVIIGLA
jgi:hypothetical protein